ncbi:P-loop NTPase [Candidatus Woesearchaeota archaeon]|nr:P-loop NTPase [Candidatus Woesearchaeota archaeon]
MGKIISIVSGKGGVGKSVFALNLATALNNLGKEALLVDGNLSTPVIHTYLGAKDIDLSLQEVLKNKAHFSDVIYNHESGLKVIPSKTTLDDLRNPDFKNLTTALYDMQGFSDFIIVNSGAGFSDEMIASLEASDEIILVTSPEEPAVENSKKVIELARELKKDILGVVVNKIRGEKQELSEVEISARLDTPVLDTIFFDKTVRKSQVLYQPVVYSHPNSKISKSIKGFASRFIG